MRDECEFVFVWRTVEACPVVRVEGKLLPSRGTQKRCSGTGVLPVSAESSSSSSRGGVSPLDAVVWGGQRTQCPRLCCRLGDNCEVRDPRHGNLYSLRPLSLNDTMVRTGEYNYYFRVCGPLNPGLCPADTTDLDRDRAKDTTKAIASCQEKQGPLGFHKVAGDYRSLPRCRGAPWPSLLRTKPEGCVQPGFDCWLSRVAVVLYTISSSPHLLPHS